MVLSKKLAHKDSNLEMTESESVALPFGDSPMRFSKLFSRLRHVVLYINTHIKVNPLFSNFLKKFIQFVQSLDFTGKN